MLERLDDFTARIKRRFPQAETLTYTEIPPADILNSDKQCKWFENVPAEFKKKIHLIFIL